MKPFSSSVWGRPLLGLALLGTLTSLSSQGHADTTSSTAPVGQVAGKLMLRFKSGISAQEKSRVLGQLGGVLKRTYSTGWTLVQVPQSSTQAAINKLNSLPQVDGAEPDYRWKVSKPLPIEDTSNQLRSMGAAPTSSGNIPNDSLYPEQWALQRINAPEAWKTTTGSRDVVIADMDTGINLKHVDLIPNTFTNTAELNGKPGVDDDNNGFVDDVHGWNSFSSNGNVQDVDGHGSATAGIIGAAGNNGKLISGVNWQVTIVPIAVISADNTVTTDSIVQGIDYVLALRKQGVNVRAANCSFGGPDSAITRAYYSSIKVLSDAGVLIVCADGNENQNTDKTAFLPAGLDLPNVISVGSSNYTDERAFDSNYGLNSVDIFAPGANILLTFNNSPTAIRGGSGTSLAAPMVTGAAALLWASQSSLTAGQVKERILASARRVEQLRPFVKEGRRLDVGALLDNATHTIAGSTVTINGKARTPIGGVSIFLDDHTGTPDTTTNSKGVYALPALAGGSHTVRAELNGQPFGTLVKLNLPTGKAANPGTFYANFKSVTNSTRYAIYGHAYQIFPGGDQISKPNVDVYLNDSTVPFARTDRQGNFKISNLAEGSYAVRMVDAISGQKASNTPVIYLPVTQPQSAGDPKSPDGYTTGRFVFTDHVAPYVESTSIKKEAIYTPQTAPTFFRGTVTDDSVVDSMYIVLYRYKPDFSVIEMYDAANKKWVDYFTNDVVQAGSVKGNGQARLPFQLPLPTLEAGYNYELDAISYDYFANEGVNSFFFQVQDSSAPSTNNAFKGSSAGSG